MEKLKGFITTATQWWQRQRLARALTRYSSGMGGQLSGGIALTGLLSIAAALTIGLSALVQVFRNHPDFRDVVFDEIDKLLPGVIDTGDGGMIRPDSLVESGGWSIAGIVGILVLLNTAMRVMKTLRISLRSMFGIHNAAENFVLAKLRDLAAFIGLGLAVLATASLSVVGRAAFEWIQENIGHWGIIPDTRFVLQVMTILISLVVDAGILILLFRALAGARVPWPQLWQGALLGAVGTGALRYLGASVVTNVATNPLLASVAAFATLLLWLNIAARVTLIAAAWTADPPAPPKLTKDMLQHHDHTPNYVSVSAPETLEWNYGTFTGLVQPIPGKEPEYSPTRAAVAAKERRKQSRANPIERLKSFLAERNQPDGHIYPGPGALEPDAEDTVETHPSGPRPLVRATPDSPLGRLKARLLKKSS